ncbi:hypothetical protein VJ923_09095 [Adlercreutzia sp. R25]|uniref:hypothetical protein n=1 Tax=Adlercreutzia shanghongiae TaxID=3111773 RepID=UPI002DBD90AD|nr:hypothetical protein [Adlercreutzia sp. R25]MEC4273311.1 hypothetical protein [Adlercreutzia sp. R25]
MVDVQDRGIPRTDSQADDENVEVPASVDASISVEDLPDASELTFEEKLAALNMTVMRHPLNREILYKALAYCREERPLREAEDYIASLPQFELATQNQYYLLMSLAKAHGLELIERDERGERVFDDQKEGLSEDEVDDLIASISFKTTEVGDYFVDYNKPQARLADLLGLVPERADTYVELLRFVESEPRPYGQIEALLRGKPALQTVIDGRLETMQPSVFVDKLERAGALVWKDGWTLTEEGREFLRDLTSN